MQETNNKVNKKRNAFEHTVSCSATNHLKIDYIFINFITYKCQEFRKNSKKRYRIINVYLKIPFFERFISFNRKGFYPITLIFEKIWQNA